MCNVALKFSSLKLSIIKAVIDDLMLCICHGNNVGAKLHMATGRLSI